MAFPVFEENAELEYHNAHSITKVVVDCDDWEEDVISLEYDAGCVLERY